MHTLAFVRANTQSHTWPLLLLTMLAPFAHEHRCTPLHACLLAHPYSASSLCCPLQAGLVTHRALPNSAFFSTAHPASPPSSPCFVPTAAGRPPASLAPNADSLLIMEEEQDSYKSWKQRPQARVAAHKIKPG